MLRRAMSMAAADSVARNHLVVGQAERLLLGKRKGGKADGARPEDCGQLVHDSFLGKLAKAQAWYLGRIHGHLRTPEPNALSYRNVRYENGAAFHPI